MTRIRTPYRSTVCWSIYNGTPCLCNECWSCKRKMKYHTNEEAKRKFTHVLEYFSMEKDLSPIFLFGVVASFCKDVEAVNAELSTSYGKKVCY